MQGAERTRMVEMVSAGLPVLTTGGTELAGLLERIGAGLTFPVGDHAALTRRLLELVTDREKESRLRVAAERASRDELWFASTTTALRQWLRSPVRATDRPDRRGHPIAVTHRVRVLARLVAWPTCRGRTESAVS